VVRVEHLEAAPEAPEPCRRGSSWATRGELALEPPLNEWLIEQRKNLGQRSVSLRLPRRRSISRSVDQARAPPVADGPARREPLGGFGNRSAAGDHRAGRYLCPLGSTSP
jgi:hypothetical protein